MKVYVGVTSGDELWLQELSVQVITGHGGLQEVCTVLQAMSVARRLAQDASRRVKVNLQPMAVSYVGN